MLKSVELEYVMNALNKIENLGLFPAFIAYVSSIFNLVSDSTFSY